MIIILRKYFCLVCAITLFTNSFSQNIFDKDSVKGFYLGLETSIKLTYNNTNLSIENNFPNSIINNPIVSNGISYDFLLNKNFAIYSGAIFTAIRSESGLISSSLYNIYHIRTKYVDIPLSIGFSFFTNEKYRFYISNGVTLTYLYNQAAQDVMNQDIIRPNPNALHLSVLHCIGGSYLLWNNFYLNANIKFQYPFNSNINLPSKEYLRSIGLYLGLNYRISK